MPRAANEPSARWQSGLLFYLIAAFIVAADQLSKLWIRSNLAVGQSIFELGFFRIARIQNSGAAFGIFQSQTRVLAVIAAIGAVLLIAYRVFFYRRFPYLDNWLGWTALGLLLGGTIGNLIERLWLGQVTDFLAFNLWPAFNVADSCVTVGVILLLVTIVFVDKKA